MDLSFNLRADIRAYMKQTTVQIHNHHHERCGTKGYPSNSDVIAAVFLPVAISFVVTYDDKYYAKPECKGEVK